LLPQVSDNLLERYRCGRLFNPVIRLRRPLNERSTPACDLPRTAHAQTLNLLSSDTELGGEFRIPRSLGEALQQAISILRR